MWCRGASNRILLTGFALAAMAGCENPKPRVVTPAFYHWKTTLQITPAERAYLDSFSCNRLYIKLLDVGRSPETGDITPYARLEINDPADLSGLEVTPVVFITNEVFQHILEEKNGWLAGKITDVFSAFLKTHGLHWSGEVQFDCDWTPSTRAAFFQFLKEIRKRLPDDTRLSATIRLHQYKFPDQTGVPPVDRGMLMFYNTGDIESAAGANSVFDLKDAEKYIAGAPEHYSLPLDLALPVFSWGLVYRDGELWKILPEIPASVLQDTAKFSRPAGAPNGNFEPYAVKAGTFLSGHYLRPGDLLRVEVVSPAMLCDAARLAAKADLSDRASVAFFHLDTLTLRRYPVQLLDSVCQMICLPEKK